LTVPPAASCRWSHRWVCCCAHQSRSPGQQTSIPVSGGERAGRHRRPSARARSRYAGTRGSSGRHNRQRGSTDISPGAGAGSARRGHQLKPVDARCAHEPRTASEGRSMSALLRIADSTQTSRDVRDVPISDVAPFRLRRAACRRVSVCQSSAEVPISACSAGRV